MTYPTTARRVIAVALLACGGGLLSACGHSAAPSAAATPTVTVTTTASPPASPSATPPASPSPSASSSGSGCATASLQLNLGAGNGAAGSTSLPVQFINMGSSACTLQGYPGVSFVTGVGGRQIGHAAVRTSPSAFPLITLAPGGKAHALLQVVDAANFSSGQCQLVTAHWLKVYPPSQTTAIYLAFTAQTCASASFHVLSVRPMHAGSGSP